MNTLTRTFAASLLAIALQGGFAAHAAQPATPTQAAATALWTK